MGTIAIDTKFFFLMFILYLFPPIVTIDGTAQKVRWGSFKTPVTAGAHQVDIHYRYLFIMNAGKSSTNVNVPPDGTVTITYQAPWLVFLPGRVSVA
ncbi:MAG: hypothetical protein ACT4PP_02410 [Sporichthyaceae bacterium]